MPKALKKNFHRFKYRQRQYSEFLSKKVSSLSFLVTNYIQVTMIKCLTIIRQNKDLAKDKSNISSKV